MSRVKKAAQLLLLATGCVVTVATSRPHEDAAGYDGTWLVANLFNGQTAVSREYDIELNIGYRDFDENGDASEAERRARHVLERISLFPSDDEDAPVLLELDVGEESTLLRHDPLKADTEYTLDLTDIEDELIYERPIPDPLSFSTAEGPRVTGLWRNGDTLFVVFSEPMDPDTLAIAHDSVDILWSDEGELHSVATDLNLADFVYEADPYYLRIAPIDRFFEVWVKVSGEVRGESGAPLDGNGNGVPGEAEDDFLEAVDLLRLDTCHTREDIPDPCVRYEDLPDNWSWEW